MCIRDSLKGAQAPVHRRTAGRALVLPVFAVFAWCTTIDPYCTPVRPLFFLFFAVLGARGFLKPLIFLDMAREVFFFIET